MLLPDLSATLERADLVLRRRDGVEHSRIPVADLDPVERLDLLHARVDPPQQLWCLGDLDQALRRAGWKRRSSWRTAPAGSTTAWVVPDRDTDPPPPPPPPGL